MRLLSPHPGTVSPQPDLRSPSTAQSVLLPQSGAGFRVGGDRRARDAERDRKNCPNPGFAPFKALEVL